MICSKNIAGLEKDSRTGLSFLFRKFFRNFKKNPLDKLYEMYYCTK